MNWIFVLIPIAALLLLILKVQFPQHRRPFQTGLLLLCVASILQYQNCTRQEIKNRPTTELERIR